jgi:hypothetical protein
MRGWVLLVAGAACGALLMWAGVGVAGAQEAAPPMQCTAFPVLASNMPKAVERGAGFVWSESKHTAHSVIPSGWTPIGASVMPIEPTIGTYEGRAMAYVVACRPTP